jgi:hypothetical protein
MCPEQYDVYRANGELCGYIRLRWGSLRADYPSIEGDTIYQHSFNDDFKGGFDSEEERNYFLLEIAKEYQRTILKGIPCDLTDEDVEYLTECANKILESRAKQ